MTIAYPKPHPPSPAPAGTAIHKLIHTANSALVQEAELHFHKGLKHDSDQSGRVDANSFKTLLTALNDHTPQAFQNITLGLGRKLINPQAGLAADREAVSGWLHKFAAAPEQSGHKKTTAAEMIELYWMALLRDVSFEDYSTSPLAADAAAELSALPLSVARAVLRQIRATSFDQSHRMGCSAAGTGHPPETPISNMRAHIFHNFFGWTSLSAVCRRTRRKPVGTTTTTVSAAFPTSPSGLIGWKRRAAKIILKTSSKCRPLIDATYRMAATWRGMCISMRCTKPI